MSRNAAMFDPSESMISQILPPLDSHDGVHLYRRQWPHPQPCGAILLVHGLGEHSGRYAGLARWFWQHGYTVQAYDQRGHGRSGGPRGGLSHPDDLLRDLSGVYAALAADQPRPPLLLGHSMGGLVCARAVLDRRVAPAALLLSAPALQTHAGPAVQGLARWLARVAPRLPLSQGLPRQFLSHDPTVAPAVATDPHCHGRITPALADFIFQAGARCRADAAQLAVATLLLVAGEDRLVNPAGSLAFAAQAPARYLQTQVFAESYHELFNELASIREPVLAVVARWLQERSPMAGALASDSLLES